MAIVYLSIGSNMGDRLANLQQITSRLSLHEKIDLIQTSSFYETEPWGKKNQPWFLNAVLQLKTSLSPYELLDVCMDIETALGRNREAEERWGERAADVDILFYDKEIISDEKLKIPHIYLHERAFVLVPLLEIAPNFVHPVFQKTTEQLYDDLKSPEEVFLYGTV